MVEFVGCGILYVIPRSCWFDSIFVNVHVPLRINMIIQRKLPVRNYNTYLINFLSITWAFITPVKRVEFISYRIWYRILSRCWYDIIVLNVDVSLRIKVMVQRTVCMKNYIRCLINSPSISCFFFKYIFCAKLGIDRSEHSDYCVSSVIYTWFLVHMNYIKLSILMLIS